MKNRMHWLLLSAFLMLPVPNATAELLLEENFEYELGTLLPMQPDGWYTQWTGGQSSLSVGEGLEFDGYAGSGIGNGVRISVDDSNTPHRQFREVAENVVYAAFLLQPEIVSKKGYFFSFRDRFEVDGYDGGFNYSGRVSFGENGELGLTFADNRKAVYADEALVPGQTYLVVLKYQIVEGEGNDEVSLFCFSELPEKESEEPLIGPLSDSQKPDIKPSNVALRGYAEEDYVDAALDGIRIATTWEEAIGDGSSSLCVPSGGESVWVAAAGTGVRICSSDPVVCHVFATSGMPLFSATFVGERFVSLPSGFYVVQIGETVFKVAVP